MNGPFDVWLLLGLCIVSLALFGLNHLVAAARPQYRRGRFLTSNEKAFLQKLDRVAGDRHRIFAQVRLADLVGVEEGANPRARFAAMRRVFSKSVDFVICNRLTMEPILIIELDDRTHKAADRRRRDALVDQVCDEAGLPLIRFKARIAYEEKDLRLALQELGFGVAINSFALES